MRKIVALIFILFFGINMSQGANVKNSYINFGGNKYVLLYSSKNPDLGGYINEYYKVGETYHLWSEMVAVHHFPNAYSPIDQVKSFREYLGALNCPSSLTFDDKKNSAMIDFIMINNSRLPIIMEFNVFKYQKSRKCGSMALQYAKRYSVKTAFEAEAAKKDFEKQRKKAIRRVKHYNIPLLVSEEIDKCKLADTLNDTKKTVEISDNKVDNDKETEQTSVKEKYVNEDILSQEAISTYKEILQPTENNSQQEVTIEETDEEITKEDSTENITHVEYKPYNDILDNEVILNYTKPAFIHPNNTDTVIKKDDTEIVLPQRQEQKADIKSKKQEKNNKKTKNKTYQISNTKDGFYAKPLSKKEIKARNKRLKKENSNKALKKRVKDANNKLKE